MSGFHKYRIGAAALAACALSITAPAHAAVEISAKPTSNMTCSGGVCTPTAKKAVLNVNDLATMLAGGDATVKSTVANPDIEIDAKLNWSTTSKLALDSYHDLTVNNPVTVVGTGALTITTNDGGVGGDYQFVGKGHVQFKDTNSSLLINGQPYVLVNKMRRIVTMLKHRLYPLALATSIDVGQTVYNSSPASGAGLFEGLGNTISHLTIQNENPGPYVGLFAQAGTTIRDLGLLDVDISAPSGGQYVGALVGKFGPSPGQEIAHVYVTGTITAQPGAIAGGLVGQNWGTIRASHSAASIVKSGTSEPAYLGGLVGQTEGDCIGINNNCTGIITGSYATGTITAGDGAVAGGLIGDNMGGAIVNSYATGSVTGGSNAAVGGLAGLNENNPAGELKPSVTSSYSTVALTGGTGSTIGGLIGQDTAQTGTANTYWDLDTSGVSDPSQGAGNVPNDPGITGLSDVQLKSGLPAGFDKKVWKIKPGINGGYPYLINDPPQH